MIDTGRHAEELGAILKLTTILSILTTVFAASIAARSFASSGTNQEQPRSRSAAQKVEAQKFAEARNYAKLRELSGAPTYNKHATQYLATSGDRDVVGFLVRLALGLGGISEEGEYSKSQSLRLQTIERALWQRLEHKPEEITQYLDQDLSDEALRYISFSLAEYALCVWENGDFPHTDQTQIIQRMKQFYMQGGCNGAFSVLTYLSSVQGFDEKEVFELLTKEDDPLVRLALLKSIQRRDSLKSEDMRQLKQIRMLDPNGEIRNAAKFLIFYFRGGRPFKRDLVELGLEAVLYLTTFGIFQKDPYDPAQQPLPVAERMAHAAPRPSARAKANLKQMAINAPLKAFGFAEGFAGFCARAFSLGLD